MNINKAIEKSVYRQLEDYLKFPNLHANFKVAKSLTIVVKLPPWLSTMTFFV